MTDDVLDFLGGTGIEQTDIPPAAAIRRRLKHRAKHRLGLHAVAEILPALPVAGESFHIVSDGKFDFFQFVPHIAAVLGGADEFFVSTWTMNRTNVVEMLELYDQGKVRTLNVLTGLYFKRRETAVYATLVQGISQRRQRYVAFKNHAKVLLLKKKRYWLTIEGSANLTGNPRLEQYTVTNDRAIYEFHKKWMERMLNGVEL